PLLKPLLKVLFVNVVPKGFVSPVTGRVTVEGAAIPKKELSGVARPCKALPKAVDRAVLNVELPKERFWSAEVRLLGVLLLEELPVPKRMGWSWETRLEVPGISERPLPSSNAAVPSALLVRVVNAFMAACVGVAVVPLGNSAALATFGKFWARDPSV